MCSVWVSWSSRLRGGDANLTERLGRRSDLGCAGRKPVQREDVRDEIGGLFTRQRAWVVVGHTKANQVEQLADCPIVPTGEEGPAAELGGRAALEPFAVALGTETGRQRAAPGLDVSVHAVPDRSRGGRLLGLENDSFRGPRRRHGAEGDDKGGSPATPPTTKDPVPGLQPQFHAALRGVTISARAGGWASRPGWHWALSS